MTTEPKPKPLESHETHSRRLFRHAQEQLEKGDRLQASEKAWGAVAHRVKLIADRMGWTYDTHTDFHSLKNRIAKLRDDPVVTRRLLSIACISTPTTTAMNTRLTTYERTRRM